MLNSVNGFLSNPLSVQVNIQNKVADLHSPVSCGVHSAEAHFVPLWWVIKRVMDPRNMTQGTCAPVQLAQNHLSFLLFLH